MNPELCLKLIEKLVVISRCSDAPRLKDCICGFSSWFDQLKDEWRYLASIEYACDRILREHPSREWDFEYLKQSILTGKDPFTNQEARDKFYQYKMEFHQMTDLKKVFPPA